MFRPPERPGSGRSREADHRSGPDADGALSAGAALDFSGRLEWPLVPDFRLGLPECDLPGSHHA